MERVIVICALSILLAGCASSPAIVNATQTEIATTAATVAGDIATVKEITDVAKTTGEIPKSSVPIVIRYVDKAATDVAELNQLIDKQTKDIGVITGDLEKQKARSERLLRWLQLSICVNLVFAGLVVLYIFKRLK